MRSRRLSEAREKVLNVLRDVAKELEAKAYLFGSYARGDHMLESDVDVVIVSRKFENMKFVERIELVRKMLPQEFCFDIIPLTPQELEKKLNSLFYKNISRYWIELK